MTRTTAKDFDVREASADKGYLAKANAAAIEAVGAEPYTAFKSNNVQPPGGSPWARMYHRYAYQRDDYLTHYHKRSNVESVFGMVKARFGDTLFSKTPEAQANEVLAQVLAHNLCVLVQVVLRVGDRA